VQTNCAFEKNAEEEFLCKIFEGQDRVTSLANLKLGKSSVKESISHTDTHWLEFRMGPFVCLYTFSSGFLPGKIQPIIETFISHSDVSR